MNPAVIFLLCAVTYSNADQSVALDGPEFSTLGRHFSGTPSLLFSLATKEEVIRMLLSNFQKELRQQSQNETTEHDALSYSLDDQLDLVERYMKDYDETSGKVRSEYVIQKSPLRAQHVAWNPLASFHMIRRFSRDLKALLQSLDLSDVVHLRIYNYIMEVMKGFGWPSEEDLKNQMSAILRIQHIYDLSTHELAKGIVHDRVTNVELRGSDCYDIGKHALATSHFAWAIEWLELSTQKLQNDSAHMRQMAENVLERAILVHDRHWGNEKDASYSFVDKLSVQRHERVRNRTAMFDALNGGKAMDLREINSWGLCSGKNYQDPEEKKKLFCYYESKISNNAWAIRPVKVEILSMNPLVVQYYEVIGDKMIKRIKQEAEPSLTRSYTIDDARPGARVLTSQRTSANTWINDHILQPFTAIPKKISALTGLNVNGLPAAEQLQVVSYGVGAYSAIHNDAFKDLAHAGPKGNRMATFLFYLSDVENGGSTAFPIARVAAKPIKGSAVFWYSLLSSGEMDKRTEHGSCPVILGEKWIANKWIRLYQQMFTFKCHPAGQVPFRFEVNGKPLTFDEYDEPKLNIKKL